MIVLSRMANPWNGFSLFVNDIKVINIDGNGLDDLPVFLTSLDHNIVYGMSQSSTINSILNRGVRQNLLTTNKIYHTLYEHGMKASYGNIVINNLTFKTHPKFFYNQIEELIYENLTFRVIADKEEDKAYCIIKHDNKTYIISPNSSKPKVEHDKFFNLSLIRDYVKLNE